MNKKILKSFFSITTLASVISLASCNNQNQTTIEKKYETKKAQDNKIVFATAQSKVYPLMIAMQELVPLYNKVMKDNPDFLPIELQLSDKSGANSELELAANEAKYIKEDSEKLANLILGNQSGAFLVNQYGKLLETKDILPNSSFISKILKTHTKLVGENIKDDTKIFNLPFDLSDIDAFSINIDLLGKIFELLEQNNAQIDKNSEVYKYIQQNKGNGRNIPEDSIINFIKVKANNNISNIVVNDETFNNITKIFEFARLVHNSFEIDQDKATKFGKDIRDLAIFSIDYQEDTFFKVLNNKLKGKKLWTLKESKNPYDLSEIDYAIANDTEIQRIFKETFDEFVQKNSKLEINKANTTTKKPVFYDVKYENNKNEWASWDIREYKTVFAFAAAVGYEQSIDSPTSRAFFAKNNKDISDKFTSDLDVWLRPQVTKNLPSDNYSSYFEGGSSLIPISVDNGGKEDKATKLFLKWLYSGEVDYRGKKIKVSDLISQKSSYIIPLKEKLNTESANWYDHQIESLSTQSHENGTKIDTLSKKTSKTPEEEKEIENLRKENAKIETEINYVKAAKISYESLKNFVDKNQEDNVFLPIDQKSSKIIKEIQTMLLNSTLKENATKISGEAALNKILEIIRSKE
ncbi:P68 family surface lipoprotein [Mycoplasma sp. 5370]